MKSEIIALIAVVVMLACLIITHSATSIADKQAGVIVCYTAGMMGLSGVMIASAIDEHERERAKKKVLDKHA